MFRITSLLLSALVASSAAATIPAAELARRSKALEGLHANYDPAEKLLKSHIGGEYSYNWYARNTDVHPAVSSLRYAVALLDTHDPDLLERAQDILLRFIGLQVADPQHKHFGVWPWLMEEPVGKGPYVDRNTADFSGKELVHVLTYHRERLRPEVAAAIEASLRRAVEAIRIRNVGPGYTNIAVMGAMVTLLAGELLDDREIVARGIDRVRKFHDFTRHHGAFTEYNSPTYTMVALEDLAVFRHHLNNAEAKPLVEDLFHTAWRTVASHFHPASRQWSGPNSRDYSVFMPRKRLEFIERWTGPAVDFGLGQSPADPTLAHLDARCPADLEPMFAPLSQPRTLIETVNKDAGLVATTYLTGRFSLGSINRQDTWNQRRNVIAFWGQPDDPSYCRVRLIFDGYDLSTGSLWTRQQDGRVLGAIGFATNGGLKHLSLEKLKDATFEAAELSLRFEFGGAAARTNIPCPADFTSPIHLDFDGLPLHIHVPFAAFDGCAPRWEAGTADVSRVGKTAWLDLTLHRGEKRSFDLNQIQQAAIAFAMQVGDGDFQPATAGTAAGLVRAEWGDLTIAGALKPDTYKAMRELAR